MRVGILPRTPLMFGLPDDHMVRLVSVANGARFDIPGAASFLPHLAGEYSSRLESVFFGPGITLTPSPSMMGRPLINTAVDPDLCSGSLRMLAALLNSMGSGCFNHPGAVLDSGRERVCEKLGVIAGLQVPKTVRLRIDEPSDVDIAAHKHGLHYPLLVRIAGTHGGLALVRIDARNQIKEALRCLPWGGRDLYLSQFVEYSDEEGLYRKMRIVVVGDEIFLRHSIASPDWQVHSQGRSEAGLIEETGLLATFEQAALPSIRHRITAIANALDLDYFGIDCSRRPDGSLLIFEANAAMNMLLNPFPSPNCWDGPVQRIHDALAKLLFAPDRWRHPGSAT